MTKEAKETLERKIILILLSGMVMWAGWVSYETTNKIDRSEISSLPHPWLKEKESINKQMERLTKVVDEQFMEIITNNTNAITRLEVQMESERQQREDIKRVLGKLESKLDRDQ